MFVERLADLRDRSIELIVTLESSGTELPTSPGRLINRQIDGRQVRCLIECDLPVEQMNADIRQQPGVESCRIHKPTLEEIFFGYMQESADCSPIRRTEPAEVRS